MLPHRNTEIRILAIRGLDGWLATLGYWSARKNFNVVRLLGGGVDEVGFMDSCEDCGGFVEGYGDVGCEEDRGTELKGGPF